MANPGSKEPFELDAFTLGKELAKLVPGWKVEVFCLPLSRFQASVGQIDDKKKKVTINLWEDATREDAVAILAHEYGHLQPGTSQIEKGLGEVDAWRRGAAIAEEWGAETHYKHLAMDLAEHYQSHQQFPGIVRGLKQWLAKESSESTPQGVYLMVIRGPKHIAPEKMQQLLVAGKEQLSEEEYSRLKSLLIDLQLYGLSAYLNSEIGKIMSGIQWELAISESPEWEEALIACDAAFLGRELKDMCLYAGLSPQGHKKELCARLYEADIPEVMAIMEPFFKEVEHLPQTTPPYRYGSRVALRGFDTRDEAERWVSDYMGGLELKIRDKRVSRIWYATQRWMVGIYIKEVPDHLPQTEPLNRLPLREIKDNLEELHRIDPIEFSRRYRVIQRAITERMRGEAKTMPEFNLSDLQELVRSVARLYQ